MCLILFVDTQHISHHFKLCCVQGINPENLQIPLARKVVDRYRQESVALGREKRLFSSGNCKQVQECQQLAELGLSHGFRTPYRDCTALVQSQLRLLGVASLQSLSFHIFSFLKLSMISLSFYFLH